MKTKNTIICSALALTLCTMVNALSFDTAISRDLLNNDRNMLADVLENQVAPSEFGKRPSKLSTQLIQAVKNDDKITFDVILEEINEREINDQDDLGYTAFMWAARLGRVDFARRLFWKSDLNIQSRKEGYTALMLALRHNRSEIVDFMLNNIEKFITHCDDEDVACSLDLNIQDTDGWSVLVYAINNKDKETVRRLLKIRNYDGEPGVTLNPKKLKKPFKGFLILAMEMDSSGEIFDILLNAKDNEGNYKIDLNYVNGDGWTVLTRAVLWSHELDYSFVEKILEAKDNNGNYRMTNLNSAKFEENPLFNAVYFGHLKNVKRLVEAKYPNGEYRINLDTKLNKDSFDYELKKGDTALDMAIKGNKEEIAVYLAQVMAQRNSK